ncbi:MAG: hypothetical protein QXY07_02725 [Candidatus Bathyarchaeia archaeon]
MHKGEGKPFLEVLASAINEDYRFPILEIFVFLYALGTFALASFVGALSTTGVSNEAVAYSLTASVLGTPLFVFLILVFKNLAYGFGSDIEKGIIQTYLSYPLRRHQILSAKLLSAVGLSLLILLSIQIPALYLLAPDVIAGFFGTVLLTYAASLSPVLFISGIILLATLFIRRGGLSLVFGIILYFALSIVSSIMTFMAFATKSAVPLKVISIFYPNTVLNLFYHMQFLPGMEQVWTPTFLEVALYLGASYTITAFVFSLSYIYFCRRFNA